MRWARHSARIEGKRKPIGFSWQNQKKRKKKGLDVGGRIKLRDCYRNRLKVYRLDSISRIGTSDVLL
jgi:hypothetical protein